ncbi:MAG: phosphatidylserine/phosphatidylglycerophosphate/cardiolipin synthase family protein [bacterium]
MAKPPDITIEKVSLEPDTVPNDGKGSARVSAAVSPAAKGSSITQVLLDLTCLSEGEQLQLPLEPEGNRDDNGNAIYSAGIRVPLLTDPGVYELPLVATDSQGKSATGHARLGITYQRPRYGGDISSSEGRAALQKAGNTAMVPGNRVEVLTEGEHAFKKRMEMIKKAQKQINLQTYFISSSGWSGELLEAMLMKAGEGVEVNLIINMSTQIAVSPLTTLQLGLKSKRGEIEDNRQALTELSRDLPELEKLARENDKQKVNLILVDDKAILGQEPRPVQNGKRSRKWLEKMVRDRRELEKWDQARSPEWMYGFSGPGGLPSLPMLSYAVHEKILTVDADKAVVGGRNLEDKYFTYWIDKDVYLEGPVVKDIRKGFLQSFNLFAANQRRNLDITDLEGEQKTEPGKKEVCFVQSRPWLDQYYTMDFLVTAFQLARERILITSQYIVLPDSLLKDALLDAARRGVEVHVLMNSQETNQEVGYSTGYFLSLNYLEDLINAGIRVYEIKGPEKQARQKSYLHAKEFLIDGKWTIIGSFNLTIRSCYIESENLVGIPDPFITRIQEEVFWKRIEMDTTEITRDYLEQARQRSKARTAIARYLELLF